MNKMGLEQTEMDRSFGLTLLTRLWLTRPLTGYPKTLAVGEIRWGDGCASVFSIEVATFCSVETDIALNVDVCADSRVVVQACDFRRQHNDLAMKKNQGPVRSSDIYVLPYLSCLHR